MNTVRATAKDVGTLPYRFRDVRPSCDTHSRRAHPAHLDLRGGFADVCKQ